MTLKILHSSKASAGSAHYAGPAPKIPGGRPSGLKFRIFFDFWSLWSPIFRIFARSFFHLFFASNFLRFLDPFWLHFGTSFGHFGSIFASLFRASILHRILIDFSSNFGASEPQNVSFYCSRSIVLTKSPFCKQVRFLINFWIILAPFLDSFGIIFRSFSASIFASILGLIFD